MKRKSLLFLLLFALMAPWAAQAQTTVEIGDGTTTQYYVPIGTYYNYSITEQLYTAEEIGTAGTISSISFNYAGTAAKDFPITVYMANVDAANLSTGISLADADEVFDGTLSVTGAGWATINLDTPFAYDGSSNLLIGINKDYVYWYSGGYWYGTPATNMARYSQQDGSGYTTATTPGSVSGTRPNIQMVITPGSGPVCEKPETLEVSNVTANSATLTWTGGSGTYNVEYKGGDAADWTAYLSNTSATTVNLTSLTPGTTYSYRVQSVCTDGVSGWKSVTFMTMFGIPLVESFGTAIPTSWSIYNGLLETVLEDPTALETYTYGWSFGSNNGVFDDHARINIYGTSCKYWLVLPTLAMENNVQLMFEVAYTAYSGTGAPATTGTDDKFVVLANVGRGWTILRQWDNAGSEYVLNDLNTTPTTVALDLSAYAGQPITIAFYGESTVSNADNNLHIDNVSIDYVPACPKPTNLAVNYEGNTSATVTWEGDAAGYEIDYNGTIVTGITGNSYELTGLNLGTEYEVKVRANCGTDGTSDWTNPVSFTTNLCLNEDMCILYFVTIDSYGDGWNGSYIEVTDVESGNVLAQVANTSDAEASEQQVWALYVCDGREIQFTWVSNSSWDSEATYGVFDLNEELLFSGSGAMTEPFNWTVSCVETACRKPSTPVASEIGPHSAVLSWTEYGPATEWTVAYKARNDEEFTTVSTTMNPYTLTGLEPETQYTVKVLPLCEVDKWSDEMTFNTNVPCPTPTNIVVSDITATSALVSWLGFGENYDLRYMPMPTSKGVATTNNAKAHRSYTYNPNDKHVQMPFVANPDAQRNVNTNANTKGSNLRDSWYYYDNGTSASPGYGGIGTGSEADVYWAVMFPAGMISETTLTKIAVYEEPTYNDNPITLYVYAGGNTAPNEGDLLYTEEFTTTPANDFEEFTLSSPVTINPLQNLWIVLMENGTYPACGSTDTGDPNGRWISLDGEEWIDVADAGLEITWMVRAYLEGTFEPEGDWIEVNGINASEYELTGLDPTTTYLVQIRSNCEGNLQTDWTGTSFTTLDACHTPYDLQSTAEATSATLNWTGSQDSYTLRYRYSEEADPSAPATIILEAHDVWEDQSGYQMLFDADATAFGTLWNASHQILVDGEQYSGGDLPTTYYDEFEYMIPEDADGSLSTTHIVMDGSVTITIPAGTYDYVILNPSPDENYNRFYIAADNGEVPCAGDDYVFEPGVTYHFTMGRYGTGDGAAFEVTSPMSDWVVVENITTDSYELTGLTPETEYEWQVMGMNCDGNGTNTEWSEIANFTTTELTTVTQTIALSAGTNWISSYVEVELTDLQTALTDVLGTSNVTITISSQTDNSTLKRGRWTGQLTSLDLTQMYTVEVPSACEITLEGMPIDPAQLILNISFGENWIAFPFAENMALADAFAGFATSNDVVSSQTENAKYLRNKWTGTLSTLIPGQGYIYSSVTNGTQPFVYPTANKSAKGGAKPATMGPRKAEILSNFKKMK